MSETKEPRRWILIDGIMSWTYGRVEVVEASAYDAAKAEIGDLKEMFNDLHKRNIALENQRDESRVDCEVLKKENESLLDLIKCLESNLRQRDERLATVEAAAGKLRDALSLYHCTCSGWKICHGVKYATDKCSSCLAIAEYDSATKEVK